MFIKTFWNNDIPLEELHINANPNNKIKVESVLSRLDKVELITLINPLNNRTLKIDIKQIESIESYSNSSIVRLSNDKQEYMIQKRLKELDYLNQYGIYKINNSIMISISKIKSFQVITNARLEVETAENQKYIVSRYYAKKIKEELLCSNN